MDRFIEFLKDLIEAQRKELEETQAELLKVVKQGAAAAALYDKALKEITQLRTERSVLNEKLTATQEALNTAHQTIAWQSKELLALKTKEKALEENKEDSIKALKQIHRQYTRLDVLKELNQIWDTLKEKEIRLQSALAIETSPQHIFKLEHEINAVRLRIDDIERQIDDLESDHVPETGRH